MYIYGVMAADPNGVVGMDGKLPWSYPEEYEHFKRTVRGHVMIMGRKTFIDTPTDVLKASDNIILTRDKENSCFTDGEVKPYLASSLDEIKILLDTVFKDRKIFMVGGSEVARIFFEANLVNEFILTKIHQCYEGNCILDLSYMKDWNREQLETNDNYTIYRLVNPNPIN